MVYLWSLIGRLNQIVWLLFDIYEVDDLQLRNQRKNEEENLSGSGKPEDAFPDSNGIETFHNSCKQGVEGTFR